MRRSISALVAIVLLVCAFMPFSAVANEPAGPASSDLELVVEFVHEGAPLPGTRFSLYRIGDFDESGPVTLDAAYAARFSVSDVREQHGWASAAREMAEFVKESKTAPTLSATTLDNGCANFVEADGLTHGIYLVVGDDVDYQGTTYSSLPFLMTMPSWDPEDRIWRYQAVAKPKPGERAPDPTPAPTPVPSPTSPDGDDPSPLRIVAGLLPKTGDEIALCAFALAVAVLGLAARRFGRNRR